jgi:exodeoxyribonuclease-3
MKIATFNINNVNRRLSNLLAWLKTAKPDVVCLQELKAAENDFPRTAIEAAGYTPAWVGEKTWNGVAILARKAEPVVIRRALPGDPNDKQARYLEAAVKGVVIVCVYAPNGNPQPGPKFDYKLAWLARLKRHAASLRKTGVPIVIAGDFNVAPTPLDIYPTKSWDKDALVQPASRKAYAKFVDDGWTDAFRLRHPDQRAYTFWDYKRNRWPRDAGLRLDHILLSDDLAAKVKKTGIDKQVRGEEGASDHAPMWAAI